MSCCFPLSIVVTRAISPKPRGAVDRKPLRIRSLENRSSGRWWMLMSITVMSGHLLCGPRLPGAVWCIGLYDRDEVALREQATGEVRAHGVAGGGGGGGGGGGRGGPAARRAGRAGPPPH